MQAYQSKEFRKMSPEAKRAALKSSIAALDPDSGFERDFEYEGKTYRAVPLNVVSTEQPSKERPAEG